MVAPETGPALAFFGGGPAEAGKGGKGGTWGDRVATPFTAFAAFSIDGAQNCLRFRMLKQILPQQVIVPSAGFCQSAITKAQVAECIHAGSDAQSVGRQPSVVAVLATDGKHGVVARAHIEASVSQRVKCPVRAGIFRGDTFGHRENGRLQLGDVADSEESIHKSEPF